MHRNDWRCCSQEDDTISLHDCVMSGVERGEDGLWLMFEDGFYVTKDNSRNPTGRHRLTGKAAVFLKDGAYLEGAWNRNCTMQNPGDSKPIPLQEIPIHPEQFMDWSPEVLDFAWEPEKQHLSMEAIDRVGYCEINFTCVELWFCWNELPEDAWFQDWPRKDGLLKETGETSGKTPFCKTMESTGGNNMPTTEWLNQYETIKAKLACKTDLDAYFTENVIGNMGVDVLDIGMVHFPTGTIFACDPLVELEDTPPFLQTIPAGTYPVKICVVPSEKYGDRYACVKVEVSREKPVRYELAMTGNENLEEELDEGDYFGFGVDAGMGCVADIQTQAAFKAYWAGQLEEAPEIDPYNDLFCNLLEENAKAHPNYQRDYGDWLNWTVPDTDCNLPIFASGWGDGYYPVYFGYDARGEVCAVYVHFLDIEADYAEQE